tara:strand:+ start:1142 stop:1444 length:303 start_codon:yes stop_codon:yes gene_type:complete
MAFKMKYKKGGFPFKKDEEYTPQSKSYSPDLTPQTDLGKMDVGELEGHIEGTFDNEYFDAKQDGKKDLMKKYENRMLRYKKEIEDRGGKYTHVDMSKFGK